MGNRGSRWLGCFFCSCSVSSSSCVVESRCRWAIESIRIVKVGHFSSFNIFPVVKVLDELYKENKLFCEL
jgi:hypothetical protein